MGVPARRLSCAIKGATKGACGCLRGQTAMGRNLPRAVVTPAVEIAYSAMVAHMALDREGYVLNQF